MRWPVPESALPTVRWVGLAGCAPRSDAGSAKIQEKTARWLRATPSRPFRTDPSSRVYSDPAGDQISNARIRPTENGPPSFAARDDGRFEFTGQADGDCDSFAPNSRRESTWSALPAL